MKRILLGMCFALSFAACDESSTCSETELQFVNNSNNPYTVYIDGSSRGTLNGKASVSYKVTVGSHIARVLQNSGFAFTTTDQSYTITLSCDETGVVSFP